MATDAMWTPGATGMSAYAKNFVEQLTAGNRLPLDYSARSLRVVDFIVDGLRKGRTERGRVERTLFGLGAYVGEVLVRRTGAVWVDFDASQREFFAQPVGVRMPDGRVWNPLGKVVNRFTVGPEESVQQLYPRLHGHRLVGKGMSTELSARPERRHLGRTAPGTA
jgi:hypothetical protein